MSKAILLIRVSTAKQELDSQTQAVKNEALKQGFKEKDLVIITDVESAIKLSEEERNGLNKMKKAIEEDKKITHVFIYELSRLSRRQLVLFSIREYLIDHNIQPVCCTPYFRLLEDGKLSQTANLMFSIFASMAESEMSLKQERMKRGRLRNKMTGKNNCGPVLYGYKTIEDKTIVVDEETMPFVVDMFTMYASGLFTQLEVAKELYLKYGKASDTKEKMKHKINNLLHRKEYCGTTKYPRVISEDLFEKAQQALVINRITTKKSHREDALLKRIIFDKKTGCHLTYSSNAHTQRYTLKQGSTPNVDKNVLDKYVWQLVVALHTSYITDTSKVKNEIREKMDAESQKAIMLKLKTTDIQKKLDLVEERLIYGSLSKEKAEQMIAKLENEKMTCESEQKLAIEKASNYQKMLDAVTPNELPDYDNLSFDEKVAIVRSMIERIDISKPSYMWAKAEIRTKVDHFLYTLDIETRKKICTMSTKLIL
jgi:DNA invertase Pin-like site-specific DNA recombinase